MNCKRCGKEIVGEIQRYCNDCKRELRGGEIVKSQRSFEKASNVESTVEKQEAPTVKEKVQIEKTVEKDENKKEKKPRIFSIGYILLVFVIMVLTFLASCIVGFSIGPVLPI